MQMSPTREGDCTTNSSVVVQISKRQDLCPVSSNSTTPLTFVYESCFETTRFGRLLINSEFLFKIAALGEGRKPSHEEYVAESEFALLGILAKECLMMYFYLDFWWTT